MKILFFAQARTAAGMEGCELRVQSPLTQAEFWTLLIARHPALAALQKVTRLARNETYLLGDELLQPSDEIAIIPPVSGG